ncbi:MAG: CHASE domain-containing protein, partial [Pseudomonadota bacterium]
MKSSFNTPVFMASLCLLATLGTTYLSWSEHDTRSRSVFETYALDNKNALVERLYDYRLALDGVASMIRSYGWPDRATWADFVTSLDIEATMPGVSGVALITSVEQDELPAFVERVRASGAPEFEIHPKDLPGPAIVIEMIEPLAGNERALGLNIVAQGERSASALRARDIKKAQLTPRLLLVQDTTRQPGFVLDNPIFSQSGDFIGWAVAPFIARKSLANLSPAQRRNFWLSVYDSETADPETVIYNEVPADAAASAYSFSENVEVLGRVWRLEWRSTPDYDASHRATTPWIIFVLGLVINAMIVIIYNNLRRREQTVRKQVEEQSRELLAKEKQTSLIVDNAMLAIILLDEHEHIIAANRATGDMFDVNEKILIGSEIPKAWGLGHLSKSSAVSLIKSSSAQGRRLYLEPRVSSWTTEDGKDRTVVMIHDVTQREESAAQLRETEARWNAALVGAEIGVFDIDLRSGTSIVSDTWKNLMGIPLDVDVDTQQHFLDRIHPEDLKTLEAADAACISGETSRSVAQYRMRFGDAEWRWMRSNAFVAERDNSGRALRLLGAQTDVTDLVHAQSELEQSEKRFRALLENAPVGMAMCNQDGVFVGYNSALCDLTGYSEQDLQTRKLRDIFVREDFRQLVPMANSLKTQETQALKKEFRLRAKSGDIRWCLVSVAWSSAALQGQDIFIVQMQDISEMKNIDQMKAQFVSTVSHELRTPLTSIKGALALLVGQFADSLPDAGARLLNIAEQNSNRLAALVNDILDMEKIAAGEIDFEFSANDLGELVEQSVEELAPYFEEHQVTVRTQFPEDAQVAFVDPGRLQQVMNNLLSNAAKFSDDDSVVDVALTQDKGRITISVENTGAGIPESFRKRIFQPFQQADSSDTRK